MSASVDSSESTGLNPALSDPERWLRLPAVQGYEPQRVNDMLLFCPAAPKSRGGVQTVTAGPANQQVIFFPGDVQNFHKVMSSHHENQPWQRWSLENVAELLSRHFELRGAKADPELAPFLASITDMYWLDGGHPGGSSTWVTSQEALKDLASSGIGVHSHVTPYEVRDSMRAWVRKEHKRFVRALQELGVPIVDKLHFENQLPSLEQHFRVLEEF